MTNAIVFKAEEIVNIVGYQQDCECSHCGRELKIGVKLEGFSGVFGADCLARAIKPYVYNGRKHHYSGASLKQFAIVAGKGAEAMNRNGFNAHHMRHTLATDLRSV